MAGKLCWALGLVLLFAAAVLTQAPLAVGLLGFFLLLTLLLVLEVRYLRGKVEAELIVPDQPAAQVPHFQHQQPFLAAACLWHSVRYLPRHSYCRLPSTALHFRFPVKRVRPLLPMKRAGSYC